VGERRLAGFAGLSAMRAPQDAGLLPLPAQRYFFLTVMMLAAAVAAYIYLDEMITTLLAPVQGTVFRGVVSKLSRLGKSHWYLVPAAGVYAACRWRYRLVASRAGYVFMSVALTGIAANILKIIFGRPRPRVFLEQGDSAIGWFELDSALRSMPSGHATTFAAVAVAFAVMFPRYRVLILIAGVLLSLGRVITLDHYVSDVVAGLALGAAGTLLLSKRFVIRG